MIEFVEKYVMKEPPKFLSASEIRELVYLYLFTLLQLNSLLR